MFLVVLLSETLRRKAKLGPCENTSDQDKYDYRIQWLDFTRRLSAAHQRQDLYQAVLLGFCENLGMGQGALYLRETSGNRISSPCTNAKWPRPTRLSPPTIRSVNRRRGVWA